MAKPVDWEALLVKGHEPLRIAQRVFRHLPQDPRCKLCYNPFGGVGGRVVGIFGWKPSRKNPNVCQYCFDHLPAGGIEIDIGVVFADVRASTALGEQSNATDFAKRLNEFYAVATKVLIHNDGVVDKLIGDEVMGLFIPGIAGPNYRRKAAIAALELASEVTALPLGVAANAGVAFVGNVGSGTVLDFTALVMPSTSALASRPRRRQARSSLLLPSTRSSRSSTPVGARIVSGFAVETSRWTS